ncbi:MAG: hypothetical protein AB4372_03920 [Xenococcus sp. (in: cyanobacteria)]
MENITLSLLSGIGSGLIVAIVNYWLTLKLMNTRNKKEFESCKYQLIEDLVRRFLDVRINYENKHYGRPYDKEFEVRNHETIPLTLIWKDLQVKHSLLLGPFYDLMQLQFDSTCKLAQAITEDEVTWNAAIKEWDEVLRDVSKAMASEFSSKRIISPLSR